MKLFIFILLSFCFLNSHLVYATDCFKPNPVKKDLEKADKEVSVASNKQIQKPIPKHVLEQAQKSVWEIEDFLGSGTGFFISKNEFVTNFHVAAVALESNSYDFTLKQKDNHKTLRIKKIKHLSPLSDLAILEIEGEVGDYLNLATKDPQLKDNLSLIGYPNGEFKIIDKTHDISYENKFEYMYVVKHNKYFGASGSPILNQRGEVVGVFRAVSNNYINIVKIIHLKNLLKQDSPSFENPKDYLEHSIKELELLAESGDMIAQYELGFFYQEGLGVEKDLKEAVRWYRKAAEQGYMRAQNTLGNYFSGLGMEEDLKEAVRWFEKAADQGNAISQYNLSIMYEKGRGVEEDPEEAVRWLRKAAEQEYAPAQYNLGVFYTEGRGVEQDPKEAVRWYRKAAEQEYALAQFNLGIMYGKGRGVEQDPKEAARWFEKAAEQGYAPAQVNLGLIHAEGLGVEQDPKEAARWFEKAAGQGFADAQFNLGFMHESGLGVEEDPKEAARWYRKAADQKFAPAQFNLGVLHQEGLGVEQDPKEAVIWFRRATEQGYMPALEMLEKYPELLEVQQIGF